MPLLAWTEVSTSRIIFDGRVHAKSAVTPYVDNKVLCMQTTKFLCLPNTNKRVLMPGHMRTTKFLCLAICGQQSSYAWSYADNIVSMLGHMRATKFFICRQQTSYAWPNANNRVLMPSHLRTTKFLCLAICGQQFLCLAIYGQQSS